MRKDIDHIELLHLQPGFIRPTLVYRNGERFEASTCTTIEQAAEMAERYVGPIEPANIVHVVRRQGKLAVLAGAEAEQWRELHLRQFADTVRSHPWLRRSASARAVRALDAYLESVS